MAGNSGRRGAVRKPGTKKGQVIGSGGQKPRGLKGKGPTEARFLLSRDGASYGGPPTSSRSTEVTVRP